jgi:hypothetical protein
MDVALQGTKIRGLLFMVTIYDVAAFIIFDSPLALKPSCFYG